MTSPNGDHRCRNCDHDLQGADYCSACGQRDIDFKQDWKGLVGEYASSMFNLDGKVPRGIFDLLFRPGKMTVDYLDGKRASQIPPVRLYLFSSLVFFIWISYAKEFKIENLKPEQFEQMEFSEDTIVGPEFAKAMAEKFQDVDSIKAEFHEWLPRMFLLGVPALALVTRIVFRKRKLAYVEHVIISMHLQTFLLVWIMFLALLQFLIGSVWAWGANALTQILDLWVVVYPIFASRHIFEMTWTKAIFSTIALELLFSLMVFVGITAVSMLAIWLA